MSKVTEENSLPEKENETIDDFVDWLFSDSGGNAEKPRIKPINIPTEGKEYEALVESVTEHMENLF